MQVQVYIQTEQNYHNWQRKYEHVYSYCWIAKIHILAVS